MTEPYIIDDSNFEDDALHQAVKNYKEAMRTAEHDLDVEYFVKTLNAVNSSSPLKVACNPVDEEHQWNHDAKLYNVSKITVDEEHHLTVQIRKDHEEYSVDKALDTIDRLKRELHGMMGPIMFHQPNGEKVKLTDVYSHAFVEDAWAGLPFDVVLGYFSKEAPAEAPKEAKVEEE